MCCLIDPERAMIRCKINPENIKILIQINSAREERKSINAPNPEEKMACNISDMAIQTDMALPIKDLDTFSIIIVFINILKEELHRPKRRLIKYRNNA